MANSNPLRHWERKVDHQLLALLDRLQENPAKAAQRVAVFISFQGESGRLKALGLQLRSVAGSVAVVTVALGDVPRIAAASDISFIELARTVTLGFR